MCKPEVGETRFVSMSESHWHQCYRPKDYEELFNLRHAQARNVIERIFGVLKRRFKLSTTAPEYPLNIQAMFIVAMALLHNFIRVHDPNDDASHLDDTWIRNCFGLQSVSSDGSDQDEEDIEEGELSSEITPKERERATRRRDIIAKAMWRQYQEVLEEQEQ